MIVMAPGCYGVGIGGLFCGGSERSSQKNRKRNLLYRSGQLGFKRGLTGSERPGNSRGQIKDHKSKLGIKRGFWINTWRRKGINLCVNKLAFWKPFFGVHNVLSVQPQSKSNWFYSLSFSCALEDSCVARWQKPLHAKYQNNYLVSRYLGKHHLLPIKKKHCVSETPYASKRKNWCWIRKKTKNKKPTSPECLSIPSLWKVNVVWGLEHTLVR